MPNLDQCENEDSEIPDTACLVDENWRCTNGQCIGKRFVCDGSKECEDGSDEVEGCELYMESQCKSWNGEKHEKCHNDTSICTLPKFNNDYNNCLECDKENHTRCNDGWCIDVNKINDGVKDCKDGSDEDTGKF